MLHDRGRAWMRAGSTLLMAAGLSSCGRTTDEPGPRLGAEPASSPGTSSPKGKRPGVSEVTSADLPASGEIGTDSGGAIYVPAYSHVYTDDVARPFNVAVTLVVRNTDRTAPLFLTAVRYLDSGGQVVRDYAPKPLRVAPLAAAEFFVRQNDTDGGSSASFLVEWRAGSPGVSAPLAEAVMVGTAMNQAVSFISQGRPVPAAPSGR